MRSTRRLMTLVLLAATVLVAAAIATAARSNSPTAGFVSIVAMAVA